MEGRLMELLCDTPIQPKALQCHKFELMTKPYEFISGKKVIPTQIASIKSNVMIAFLELAGAIYSGLDWDKKGRIVVEYDPLEKKFEVVTFQEAEDLNIDPDHEEYPSFLLNREDR